MIGDNRPCRLFWIQLFTFIHVHFNALCFQQVQLLLLILDVGTSRVVKTIPRAPIPLCQHIPNIIWNFCFKAKRRMDCSVCPLSKCFSHLYYSYVQIHIVRVLIICKQVLVKLSRDFTHRHRLHGEYINNSWTLGWKEIGDTPPSQGLLSGKLKAGNDFFGILEIFVVVDVQCISFRLRW